MNEPLHTLRPINRIIDVVAGVPVERILIPLFKNPHEPAHGAERLLQVVGGGVGELLEVLVGPAQVLRGSPQASSVCLRSVISVPCAMVAMRVVPSSA